MKRWEKFNEEEIYNIFINSVSLEDFMHRLGYSSKNAYKDIRKKYPYITFRYKNLINQKFGKLTVVDCIKESGGNGEHKYWKCICDCGKEYVTNSSSLINGITTQCIDCAHLNKRDNVIGKIFGKLTVISYDEERSKNSKGTFYFAKCSCGNPEIKSYNIQNLKNGATISCGCYKGSKGELKIKDILIKNNIPFKTQYIFQDCRGLAYPLKFDFYLPKDNILIEYQGEQHYCSQIFFGGEEKFQKQQYFDNKKREYCKNNNYYLIEIPYTDYNKINDNYLIKLINDIKIKNLNSEHYSCGKAINLETLERYIKEGKERDASISESS